jgi:hypothetical protein
MPFEDAGPGAREGFEISSRFRLLIEERIERLERDAEGDEARLAHLDNDDHIRRQRRLVAVQRAEALRMRGFLDRSGTRIPPPLMAQ